MICSPYFLHKKPLFTNYYYCLHNSKKMAIQKFFTDQRHLSNIAMGDFEESNYIHTFLSRCKGKLSTKYIICIVCTYRYPKVVKTIRYTIMKNRKVIHHFLPIYVSILFMLCYLTWLNFANNTSRLLLLFLKTLLLLCRKSIPMIKGSYYIIPNPF